MVNPNPKPPYVSYGAPPAPTACESCAAPGPMRFMGQYMQNFDPKGTTLETGYECLHCFHKHLIHESLAKPTPTNDHRPNQETGIPHKA